MISVKISYNSEIRRVPIEEKDFKFNNFVEVCKKIFGQDLVLNQGCELRFCYEDDEKDRVTCTSDFCFQEALRLHKLKNANGPLRLELFIKKASPQNKEKAVRFAPVKDLTEDKLDSRKEIKEEEPVQEENNNLNLNLNIKPPLPSISSEVDINFSHPAFCDGCSSRIQGIRFKCRKCEDFDYCFTCFHQNNNHSQHPFAKMFKTLPQPIVKENLEPIVKEKPEPIVQETKQPERPQQISDFESKLQNLEEIGFTDRARNIKLLVENKCDLSLVIAALLDKN